MIALLKDKFLSKEECKNSINFYKKNKKNVLNLEMFFHYI